MILHIPHSSINTLNKKFDCNLEQELYRMTDIDTEKLFHHSDAKRIVLNISRLICDVERFEDDDLEIMADKGMGVCYTTNSFGTPLRTASANEREQIIKDYYKPHHHKLTDAVELELNTKDNALIVDCHSFSNIPLPHEDTQEIPRPNICIGTDSFHTNNRLRDLVVDYFTNCGYIVKINNPFAGTLIPMKYYHKDKRVIGIMIELNRDLYKRDFNKTKENIQGCLEKITKFDLSRHEVVKDI